MRARHPATSKSDEPPETLRDVARSRRERESGPQLKAARLERETIPPPNLAPIEIEHIQLGVSVDELLYRYSVGDISGALSVGMLLLDEEHIPMIVMPDVVITAVSMSGREEYVLSLIDGWSSMSEIVESSRLSTLETLHTFCELIEKGVLGLH